MKIKKILFLLCFLFCTSVVFSQTWLSDFDNAKKVAKAMNKLILLDFTATWCNPCKQLEKDVWDNKEYASILKKYVIVQLDIDYERTLASSYNVKSIPNIKVVDCNGDELDGLVGYGSPKRVINFLEDYPADVQGYMKVLKTKI